MPERGWASGPPSHDFPLQSIVLEGHKVVCIGHLSFKPPKNSETSFIPFLQRKRKVNLPGRTEAFLEKVNFQLRPEVWTPGRSVRDTAWGQLTDPHPPLPKGSCEIPPSPKAPLHGCYSRESTPDGLERLQSRMKKVRGKAGQREAEGRRWQPGNRGRPISPSHEPRYFTYRQHWPGPYRLSTLRGFASKRGDWLREGGDKREVRKA